MADKRTREVETTVATFFRPRNYELNNLEITNNSSVKEIFLYDVK
jgi:hypothetical protein